MRFIHLFILSKIGLYEFIELKEKRISFFLKDVTLKEFDQLTLKFNNIFFGNYLKSDALKKLEWHKKNNHEVVILSATLSNLLSQWSSLNDYILIANNLSFKDDILTGYFERPDCSYDEKLIRLKEIVDLNDFDHIYGYGDTQSDISFLNIVDEPYFRYFKQ